MNGLDPEVYLRDMLGRIADRQPGRLSELPPWNIHANTRQTPPDPRHPNHGVRPDAHRTALCTRVPNLSR
jgi:hypothetical protein